MKFASRRFGNVRTSLATARHLRPRAEWHGVGQRASKSHRGPAARTARSRLDFLRRRALPPMHVSIIGKASPLNLSLFVRPSMQFQWTSLHQAASSRRVSGSSRSPQLAASVPRGAGKRRAIVHREFLTREWTRRLSAGRPAMFAVNRGGLALHRAGSTAGQYRSPVAAAGDTETRQGSVAQSSGRIAAVRHGSSGRLSRTRRGSGAKRSQDSRATRSISETVTHRWLPKPSDSPMPAQWRGPGLVYAIPRTAEAETIAPQALPPAPVLRAAAAAPAAARSDPAKAPEIDVEALTQKVVNEIDRKMRIERERRGL